MNEPIKFDNPSSVVFVSKYQVKPTPGVQFHRWEIFLDDEKQHDGFYYTAVDAENGLPDEELALVVYAEQVGGSLSGAEIHYEENEVRLEVPYYDCCEDEYGQIWDSWIAGYDEYRLRFAPIEFITPSVVILDAGRLADEMARRVG